MNERSNRPGRTRGKPMRALAVLLGGWVLMRTAFWSDPISLQVLPPQGLAAAFEADAGSALMPARQQGQPAQHRTRFEQPLLERQPAPLAPAIPRPIGSTWQAIAQHSTQTGAMEARHIIGHTLLLAAGLSNMELSPGLMAMMLGSGPRVAPPRAAPPRPVFAPAATDRFAREASQSRWTMDSWALLREDDSPQLISARPSYGRSQLGAVLRYRLAPASGHAPQAHLRASAALAGSREQELAAGLSARPLPKVPVRVYAEARLRDGSAGREARAAAFAVSEFPPLPLPGGATAEAYVQAGYVSGTFATGFVDGQVRIARELASADDFRLSAGGGAWGGAQEGSGRLDIGPSAAVTVGVGRVNARVSADYRFRVAGEAAPSDGPALTISAGF